MKFKLCILIALAVFMITAQGCGSLSGGKQTGIRYLLEQASSARQAQQVQEIQQIQPESLKVSVPAAADPSKEQAEGQQTPRIQKKVCLTFDDGPDNINTPMVLDILDSYGIKATFFVIGTNVEKKPALLKDIIERGHALGNHTYNHRYDDIYAGVNGFLQSIRINEELIFRIVGQRPKLVRDPGGEVRNNEVFKQALTAAGYRLVNWDVDSYDSRKNSAETDIVENIHRQISKERLWPGMIILLHDGKGHMNTVRALPTVIEMLKNEGFEFEVVK